KWPIFKHRNLATLFKHQIQHDPNVAIVLNATATSFELHDGANRIYSVTARHQGGASITVTAKHVVVCAGAIESTRLLLLLDRQYQGRTFAACDALGRYFHDHISANIASIETTRAIRLNRTAGFRFDGRTMRSLRFEL